MTLLHGGIMYDTEDMYYNKNHMSVNIQLVPELSKVTFMTII